MILTLSICNPFDLLAMETANAILHSTEKRIQSLDIEPQQVLEYKRNRKMACLVHQNFG